MEHVIRGLTFLIIPIILNGIFAFLRQPKGAEKGKVHLPNFFVILGLVTSTVFLVPAMITAFLDEPIWIPILLFVLSLLGASLVIGFVNCRVSYDEDGFVAKNFFGIKRKFTYDQVTAIKENMHEDYIYIGKRKVMIDEFSVGGIEFVAYVRKKYRTIHNGQALPQIRKTKHDIFNGNVDDTTGFLAAYIIISVVIIAFAIFLVWFIYFTPSTMDNTIEQQVTFESYDLEDERIVLTSSQDQLYKISFLEKEWNTKAIKSICDGKTMVTVYVKEITPDDSQDYYSIKAIVHAGVYLLHFEETNRWHQKEYGPLLFIPLAFAVLWGAFVAGSVIVGRNPKKYSKKVVRLFFKEGYVKY